MENKLSEGGRVVFVCKNLVSLKQFYKFTKIMDAAKLNASLEKIADQRMALAKINYDDARYDEIEEQLHALEDDFLEVYGKELESVLRQAHKQYCPDNDTLSPIAYIAQNYVKAKGKTGGYEIPTEGEFGLPIDLASGENGFLVLIPTPLRIDLITQSDRKTIWKA